MGEDPWYAHPGMQGVCVNDGNQAAHYISKENEYTSAKSCCDAHYGTYPECLGASTSPGSTGKWHDDMIGNPWYLHSDGYCLSDGNHASFFINLDRMFVSAEACVSEWLVHTTKSMAIFELITLSSAKQSLPMIQIALQTRTIRL